MARVSRLGPEWTRMLSKARVGPTRPANDQRQDGDFCDLTSQPGSSQRKSLVEPGPPCIGRGDRTLCVVERTGKPEELLGSSGSNHHALPKMKLKSESCDAMGLPASTPQKTNNQPKESEKPSSSATGRQVKQRPGWLNADGGPCRVTTAFPREKDPRETLDTHPHHAALSSPSLLSTGSPSEPTEYPHHVSAKVESFPILRR
ncbi:uncharacterized protein CIMG_13747 [Coccidioides immitis RS]|uniref:Uncharacterized protein n=1 Tax=Coccidioides immitis (strain RS) TaxID=246410 RepID=A0A0D8JW66_COCIM|nr:uncharacterized protein CIMG_13747 [Coccidioides immitis RS]KJF61570.1 hypothetical protein CIMG_13747 [Coccidioides immitis RS]